MAQPSFNSLVLSHWSRFASNVSDDVNIAVDGKCLSIADVIATARYGSIPDVSDESLAKVAAGSDAVKKVMSSGSVIYGINTGFGGSAGTRVKGMEALQNHLVTFQHYGVLTPSEFATKAKTTERSSQHPADNLSARLSSKSRPFDHSDAATSMPDSWVRGSMLIRLNSLAEGACGVKPAIVQTLSAMLKSDIVPVVPLRGSISASGDLSPLSYIAGALQGRPHSRVWTGDGPSRRQVPAKVALAHNAIEPIRLGPKEGLSLANGTSVSAAVGSLAVHECLQLAVLSQILTAMSVESLTGSAESFDPFLSQTRPHPGQKVTAANIRHFLQGSSLAKICDGSGTSIRQDRYSVRTAPQWIGPVVEDMMLAYEQISTELNSVTDNPIIDVANERFVHGGNFQARSVTCAMEKLRQGCESLGRMLFAQCTELINPATNNGLPPNLAADEPSESYAFKGADIGIAAYQSELGFLASPAGSHVQTAEMGNQALNSLALVSGRYTLESIAVLSQLAATHLVAVCQALDLRAMDLAFHAALAPDFLASIPETFATVVLPDTDAAALAHQSWTVFTARAAELSTRDSAARFLGAAQSVQLLLLPSLRSDLPDALSALHTWTNHWARRATQTYHVTREQYFATGIASPHLGHAARKLYAFVRESLEIPFLRSALEESWLDEDDDPSNQDPITIGEMNTRVYEAIRSGALWPVLAQCLPDGPVDVEAVAPTANEHLTNGVNERRDSKSVVTNGHSNGTASGLDTKSTANGVNGTGKHTLSGETGPVDDHGLTPRRSKRARLS